MKKNKALYLMISIFCLLTAALFLGCATVSKEEEAPMLGQTLEPQSIFKFSDIPIPAGFRFISSDSYSFESGGFRAGIFKYQGRGKPTQIVNFFREQMPMYNWHLLNVIEHGQCLLNFEREQESCIISLFPKGRNITITISLGPKSQLPKRTKKTEDIEKTIK